MLTDKGAGLAFQTSIFAGGQPGFTRASTLRGPKIIGLPVGIQGSAGKLISATLVR